ncbi:MAG: alpha/beta hydrolase [Gammaproteobacteria bacterium]
MPDDVLAALDAPVVIEPPSDADAAVIWLHGLGADGHDFEAVVAQLEPRLTARTRFVFPHAPVRAVTINGGVEMRAWYDIAGMDLSTGADEAGVRESQTLLDALLAIELDRGISSERVVLAGFSQGGAIALHTGLRQAHEVAGIMALSAYLPLDSTLHEERHSANANVPIFMAHGSQDPVVPIGLSDHSSRLMIELGYCVELHTYAIAHSVSGEELRDIQNWLQRVLRLNE